MKGRYRRDAGSAPAGDRTALTAPTRQERLGTIGGWLHPKMAPFGQAEQVNIEEVVGQNGGQADGNPQQGEGQANLPQKIPRHSAVVPDLVAPVDQQSGCQLEILLSEEQPLHQAVAYYFAEVNARKAASKANVGFSTTAVEELAIADLSETSDEAPVIHLLNSLIDRGIKSGASDIHIEPFENETKVRMRIDGVIMEYVSIQRNVHQPLIARIKILANLDIAEKRIPQDGHFRVSQENGFINIRVSVLPTVFGEKAVLRILASTGKMDHAGQFGMDDFSYQQFAPMLNAPNGIIYITGPTGSGKSTTAVYSVRGMI